MRIMPIDDFLEETEASRTPAVVPTTSPLDGRSYDWNRIVSEGRAARQAADGGAWHIGQLALLVEKRYRSGALQRFAEAIGESYGTVRRFRWVAGAYDAAARTRFVGLSFSHFQAVASLPDRIMWLQRAYRRGWSVDRLVRESRKASDTPPMSEARLGKPIQAATRRLVRLADEIDVDALPTASRKALAALVGELADQVETLRALLEPATSGDLRVKTQRSASTSGRSATSKQRVARVR